MESKSFVMYYAESIRGSSGVNTTPDEEKTPEGIKQAIDRQVTELKRLSRKYNIPVIVVSSFNRENYTAPVSMTAYKESGAIEYTSDIVIGLQYKNIEYTTNKDNKGKVNKAIGKLRESQTPKDIEVKVLKNRNGQPGQADFVFYPYFNYFEEA